MVRASLVLVLFLLGSLPSLADGAADADAGVARLNANDPRTAIDLFTRAIQSKELPQDILALTYHRRGLAFYKQGEAGRAILDYTIALWHEDLPKDFKPRTLNNRGLAFEAINHYETALRDYGLSIRLNPHYAEAYANRGSLRRRFNQFAEAVQDYDMALRSGHPHPQFVFVWQGMSFEGIGKRREAADAYRRALQIDVKFELARSRLAKLEEDRALSSVIGRKKQHHGEGGPLIVTRAPGVKVTSEQPPAAAAWAPSPPKGPAIINVPQSEPQEAEDSPGMSLRPAYADSPAQKKPGATPPAADAPVESPEVSVPSAPPAAMEPAPSNVPAARAPISDATGEGGSDSEFALQLGSFASEALAQAGWDKASKTAKALLEGLSHSVVRVEIPERGTMFRLYAGALPEKQSALKLCRTLREKGSACIVIKR